MEKFLENLILAEKTIKAADHLIYITFPVVKDKMILLKVLQEIKKSVSLCINSILQREYILKRIKLYKDPKANLSTFMNKCAPRYSIEKYETKKIEEIFEIVKKHKESPFEFVREGKIVILSNDLKHQTITQESIKELLEIVKKIIIKTKTAFSRKF